MKKTIFPILAISFLLILAGVVFAQSGESRQDSESAPGYGNVSPGYGSGYGPGYNGMRGQGYGYGHGGMMGPGYGPGYGGMMGPGSGYGGMMDPGSGYGRGGMMEPGYGREYGPGYGMGPSGEGWNQMTPDEKKKYNQLWSDYLKDTLSQRQQLNAKQLELHSLWNQPDINKEQIDKLSDEISDLRGQLEKKRDRYLSQCRKEFGDRGWSCPGSR